MRLIIVRHAQTENNAEKKLNSFDTPLSDLGKQQTMAVANRLKNEKITHIYTSPTHRTQETAKEIYKHHFHAKYLPVDVLIERNYGDFVGAPLKEYFSWFEKNPYDYERKIPNGESLVDLSLRIGLFIDSLFEKKEHEVVLMVTHCSAARAAINHIKNNPLNEETISFGYPNTAVTIIDFSESNLKNNEFKEFACIKHLE